MLYLKCGNCACMLGGIQLYYEAEQLKINTNDKLTNAEKAEQKSQLVRDIGLKYCCNAKLMTYINLPKTVK
jgi:hypothetical protein